MRRVGGREGDDNGNVAARDERVLPCASFGGVRADRGRDRGQRERGIGPWKVTIDDGLPFSRNLLRARLELRFRDGRWRRSAETLLTF